MNIKQCIYLFATIAFSLSSCSDKNTMENDFEPKTYNVLGKVEKGPFVSGSTITIQPMDGNLQVLGSLYSATIQDDLGNFSFGSKLFEAPFAELTANGYFFNEVDGELSSGTLNLRALVDLSDETTVNVNLLTHLKYQRIQKLIAEGMKFREANKQAQKELFTAFGLQKYAEKDASTFSIAEGTDESAALIAISSLLLVNRSEAALTEYLAKLCREFGESGKFGNNTLQQISEDKKYLSNQLSSVRENIINRYESLGIDIEVKELNRFIDWDNDGIAGNETLQEGQEVKIETTELNVPNEGGVYTIGITSPIPVYLNPKTSSTQPGGEITEESVFTNIYDNIPDANISLEKSLNENILTLEIEPLNSINSKTTAISIYDGLSNVVGTINIKQDGNNNIPMPKLGETGKQIIASIASDIAKAFSYYNTIEQYYHYNKESNQKLVSEYITPDNISIENLWYYLYRANNIVVRFKDAEAKQLGVFQSYFNVFSALYYYYMVIAWGDVPYINHIPEMDDMMNIRRTPQNEILSDLKSNLTKAIDNLENKKNESLNNEINDYFFLSKDVARILLANIYMYQGEYPQAEKLLEEVINSGFYSLDDSNYNNSETITNLFKNGSSSETIFATCDKTSRTRTNISIEIYSLVPIMTYTDVILSYAECLYKSGKIMEAESALNLITQAKSISVSGDNTVEKIKDVRLQLMLYTNTNFAFMKRNNFAKDVYGIEEYRQLLPIPQQEIIVNTSMIQNPGY
ncbi:hypothetical protein [Bacteroides sp. ET336]|uniref:hypothetical protein n=1 Tax=Bacteroides sp. ET336 TaxID=2972459 RepID=UPI0021ABEEA5|nr:hypothetical protein [Bacteroides sp. ET336]MCR8894963.1 hypothetical protein [Bacteroides sp. ET336]MDN0059459.1 hypothetical protein [Bacteroides caecigallinarum]